jgi:phage tail protein X
MATEYKADSRTYKTIQGDMWDLIALSEYGDEHAMHFIQDANFDLRFTDAFVGGITVQIPAVVSVQINLKAGAKLPDLSKLLPWR